MQVGGDVQEMVVQVALGAVRSTASINVGLLKLILRKMQGQRRSAQINSSSGRQSLRKLSRQGKQLEQVDIPSEDLRHLRRDLRRHSVDYALMREKGTQNYTIYFKSQDVERIYAALERCLADFDRQNVKKRPIQEQLAEARAESQAREQTRPAQLSQEQKIVR